MDLTLLPETASQDEVDDELAFVTVLIESLDQGADDYPEKLVHYEEAKAHCERLLRNIHGGQRLLSQSGGQPVGNGDGPNVQMAHDAGWWQSAMNGRPHSNHSSNSGISSSSFAPAPNHYATPMNGMKRARPESTHLGSGEHATKRPTPNPSNVGTPTSSTDSFEMIDGGDRARERQHAAEAAAQRRRESAQADAAFAASLAAGNQPSTFASSSSSRPSFQTTFNYNGGYQRPPPVQSKPSSSKQPQTYPQSMAYPSQQQSQPTSRPIKSEHLKQESGYPRQQPFAQGQRQPTAVVDLTASDSEADDDLAEIAPERFMPNNTRQQSVPVRSLMPGMYPVQNYQAPGYQPPGYQVPGYQAHPFQAPAYQAPGFPAPNMPNGQFVYGNANAQNTPGFLRQAMNGAMNGVNHAIGGIGGQMHQLTNLLYGTSSAQPFDLDGDSDDDDLVYGGMRAIPGYSGNEDLYRQRFEDVLHHDSTKSKEEIEALLQNIRPDEDMPAHLRVQTPEDMCVKLHKYQEMGLTWLQKQEKGSNKGGILADDMGLGKTIQMLSLMVTHRSDDPRCKTTLIVAPLALMRQWKQEIQDKLKPGRSALRVFTHHGTTKAKDWQDLRGYDVVLTTFGSIGIEVKKLEKFRLRQVNDPDAQPHATEKCIFLDPNARWYRVILDEAQCIKNKGTQTAKAACRINAEFRWCVTGTPMMNNVEELYSLVHFLRIKPYCQWEKFRNDFRTPLKSGSDETKGRAMQRLQALCKAIMLRRTKKSTFEGQPILVLPERVTTVDNPVFDDDERDFYQAIEQKTQLQFNKYLRRGTVGSNYSAILVLLLRLRQACCHPHLIKDFGVAVAADMTEDQMIEFARLLEPPVVARIKESGGNFECPVCYDVTANPAIFVPCGHDTCSECFTRLADPANAIQNGEEGNAGIRCPNCRGGIDPKRLTDFTSFKKVHMPELLTAEERGAGDDAETESEAESDDSDSDSDSATEDNDEDDTLGGFIVNDEDVDDDETESESDADGVDSKVKGEKTAKTEKIKEEMGMPGPSNASGKKPKHKKDKKKRSKKSKGKQKEKKGKKDKKAKKPPKETTLADLKKLATRNQAAKKQYLKRLRKDWVSSAKIDKTMEILEEVMAAKKAEKVLIFSQWTSLLDLLEIPIDNAGFGYRRYDGSMSPDMRGEAVDDFKDPKKDVRIMLVSLKAGNAGLNLNVASQVIILDPFWNPYIEEQAIDRAHRIGQANEVTVHRVLIQETVEDRIIALQDKKRALISEALDEKSGHQISRLGVQELAYLFGVTHNPAQRIDAPPAR